MGTFQLESKDLIAIIVIVGVFILIALDKISWEVGAPVISAIIFFYFGVKAGQFTYRKVKK